MFSILNRIMVGKLLVCLALLTGCRSAPRPVAQTPSPTMIPQFLGSPVSCDPYASYHTPNVAASPAIPPAPASNTPPSVPPAQVMQTEPEKLPIAQQPTLPTPQTASTQDPQQENARWTSTNCLPTEPEWKQAFEEQNQAMQSRLSAVEKELSASRNEMLTVNTELKASQSKIGELNQNLTHWQGETRRLETEMKSQQQSDLKSLDDLANAVNLLIQQQRNVRASHEERVQ